MVLNWEKDLKPTRSILSYQRTENSLIPGLETIFSFFFKFRFMREEKRAYLYVEGNFHEIHHGILNIEWQTAKKTRHSLSQKCILVIVKNSMNNNTQYLNILMQLWRAKCPQISKCRHLFGNWLKLNFEKWIKTKDRKRERDR